MARVKLRQCLDIYGDLKKKKKDKKGEITFLFYIRSVSDLIKKLDIILKMTLKWTLTLTVQ